MDYGNRYFSDMLRAAIAGKLDMVEAILARYMPLITKYSTIDCEPDEDLQQYLIMRTIEQLPKFDPENLK
jgi:hypothetical protein